jgi:hypothetical protein
MPETREQDDSSNNNNNNTTDSLVKLERSASGNLLFRRRKGSVDRGRRQVELKSQARAQDLYAEYEQAHDKDETLNTSKGNFQKSEAAITILAPSLSSSMTAAKQAQALYHAKNNNKRHTIAKSLDPQHHHHKRNASLSKTPVKKDVHVEKGNNSSKAGLLHTPNGQAAETSGVSHGILLQNNPDGVLMVQRNRSSYGKYQISASKSAKCIQKSLAIQRKLNGGDNMVMVVEKNAEDGIESVPKSLAALFSAGFDFHSMRDSTSTTNNQAACLKMTRWDDAASHEPHFRMSPTVRQLPELC